MQKGAEANMYRYTTNLYRYMRAIFGQKGFLTPFFAPFGIHNLIYPLQNKTLAFLPSHTSNPKFACYLPEFPSLRPGLFCTHRIDVVSLLQFLESLYMDLLGWIWLVVFFAWWFGVSADVRGRKFLSDLHGASPVLLETGF